VNEQQVLATINLTLLTLQGVLPQLTANKLAPEIIALVEAAIGSLSNVVGSSVTYGQLESLRTKPMDTGAANATTTEPKATS
jgi:hypothetical protein